MNIYTERILHYRSNRSIHHRLWKFSQEYRALATLKYLFPQTYGSFTAGDAPDLQDEENSIGVEVTAAVPERDMKISRRFSQLCEENDGNRKTELISAIKKEDYSITETPAGLAAVSTIATSASEKAFIQSSITKKIKKLPQYQSQYKRVELAIILPEIPTSDAENHISAWIADSLGCTKPAFDYIHIICHRFYQGYDVHTGEEIKITISKQEHHSLGAIARMTAEGVISLDSEEWQ